MLADAKSPRHLPKMPHVVGLAVGVGQAAWP